MKEKVREDRRPDEAEMLRTHIRGRLSRPQDRRVAADTVQLAIPLIDRIVVAAVAPSRHRTADRAIGECHQVDAEKLRSSLNLSLLTITQVDPLAHFGPNSPRLRTASAEFS